MDINSLTAENTEAISKLKTENPLFLSEQLISYLGNKRSLLRLIEEGLNSIKHKLAKEKLSIFDVFSGSGVVSRFFKQHASLLLTNDLEHYAKIINECYLSNIEELPMKTLHAQYTHLQHELSEKKLHDGIIARYYAPQNDLNIQKNERVFYTRRNAQYIDSARQLIGTLDQEYQPFFLAPLLSQASIHSNTAGIFKGFYKSKETGIGQFGGTNKDALFRIKGDIDLPFPIFSNFNCEVQCLQGDANTITEHTPPVDVAYLDPPYNQHPYGSNYFMLNLIADYQLPKKTSTVSGIPTNWNRSAYNKQKKAIVTFQDLVEKINASYLLISFNSEGFISLLEMKALLKKIGRLNILEKNYNTFRGGRNLKNRARYVTEYLYLVEKF